MGPETEIASVIIGFYNQFVSRADGQETGFANNDGIYFCIRMEHEHSGFTENNKLMPEWKNRAGGFLHVIITSLNQVFTAFSEKGRYEEVPMSSWTNTSNHDSCWKTDGLQSLFQYDFALYERANEKCPKKKRPSYREATKHIEMQSVFSLNKWVRFVSVSLFPESGSFKLLGIQEFEMKLQKVVDHSEQADDELYALKA